MNNDPAGPASPMASPWVTSGGGFAVGLFATFGVGALFQSDKYAFALTAFGFVSCLVLVIAVSTTNLAVIRRPDGRTISIGVWATSILAVVTFGIGSVGAAIFFFDAAEHPLMPTKAFYSTIGTAENGGIAPQILVNGSPTDLSADIAHPQKVWVQSNAWIEVRVRGAGQVLSQANANARLVTNLLTPAPPRDSGTALPLTAGEY